ncbi:MAG: SGNH/GDSL hydrolase family protein [Actinomycetota bacterium]|nr:SGNH/GDSL hydrolase family protein [Actinomycetota bacterium]
MSARLPLPRVWIVIVLLCTLLLAPLVLQRVTASASGPGIAVIGDSISARYNDDPGSDQQAWWSVVGRHYEAPVTIFAESGSGYVRPGGLCDGTRFGDRVADVAKSAPRIVIVEGGRNDWAFCTAGHRLAQASNARVKVSVDRFLTKLQRALAPNTTIYVLGPPWGTVSASQRSRVTAIIRSSAQRHHMRFIDTHGVFDGGGTIDGTHPNRAGSMALGTRVVDAIGARLPRS